MAKKYIAIKLKGINHWFWFEVDKFKEKNNEIIATEGWGKGGAFTEITCSSNEVTGRITSDELQYI